ncbi:hypothetical protein M0R45_006914 [Rubus argutus]|uniref:CCHC-type domain-containing protein n=1 Tax=Rubus argutus TaxID=59490 RepID=A0AAW1YS53_RUBAR
MKERLREKYVPLSYQERLLDQWQSLRQGTMTAEEFIDKFEELMLRCNVNEDPSVTLARFRTGLRPELQKELIPHDVYSLERAYQLVQELERYLKTTTTTVNRRFDLRNQDFRPSISGKKPSPSPNVPSAAHSQVKADKGKGLQSGIPGSGSMRCYKCQGYGHYAGQCPTKEQSRSLFAASTEVEADAQGELEEEVYEPEFPATDEDIDGETVDINQPRMTVVRIGREQTSFTPMLSMVTRIVKSSLTMEAASTLCLLKPFLNWACPLLIILNRIESRESKIYC